MKAIEIVQKPGTEIFWAGDEIVGVAAVDEGTAEDAVRAINVEYEVLPHFVSDAEPPKNIGTDAGPISRDDFEDMQDNQVPDDEVIAILKKQGVSFTADEKWYKSMQGEGTDPKVIAALRAAKVLPPSESKSAFKRTATVKQGDADKAFAAAAATHEGLYGVPCIVHSCLETHGSASEWSGNGLTVHISTQNLSGIAAQMAEPLNVPAATIRVLQQNIGGGFGSKFAADRWDVVAARLSKSPAASR